MNIGKKEMTLLLVLGLLVYVFIFYKFVWLSVAPTVSEINTKMISLANEKAALDKDYKTIDEKKTQLSAKKTSNERINEYLMENANMVDSLEYVDKLSLLIGSNITELNIGKPEERYTTSVNNPLKSDTDLSTEKKSGQRYYELKIDFKGYMTKNNAMELIKYIEGGTRKVKITKFAIKPLKDNAIPNANNTISNTTKPNTNQAANQNTAKQNTANKTNAPANNGTNTANGKDAAKEDKLFEVNMSISMYSLSLRASDRLYEYNQYKLNRFQNSNGILFEAVKNTQDVTASSLSNISELFGTDDLIIRERSYLTAGENFQVFGVDRNNEILRLKTNAPLDVKIKLERNSYIVRTVDSSKRTSELSGSLPDKNLITMNINVDMPTISENKNIRLNVNIINNSNKMLNVSLVDNQNRVQITDRKGNVIYGDNSIEHVSII